MRILFVTEEPIRFSGTMVRGGQIHVRNVVEGLRDRGHDVHLIDWNSEPDRPFQHSITPRIRFIDGAVRTFQQVVQVGQSIAPDVIVSKTRKVYLPGLMAARILGCSHIVHVGSSLAPPTGGLFERLDAASFASRLRAPHDGYFVVCDAIGAELRERGIALNQIYNVRNAVDADQFCPEPDVTLTTEDASRLAAVDGPLLGYVGGIVDYKGVFDLAKAVKQAESSPTVVVVGDGPACDRLKRELGNAGIFLGSVAYERMPAVYEAIDALALPSHTEGLPRVLLEAGAMELPVVATNVGGVNEIVIDRKTGLLCPPQRPEHFATRIDDLFEERNRTAMGEAARKKVLDEFTWSAQYDRYEQFFDN